MWRKYWSVWRSGSRQSAVGGRWAVEAGWPAAPTEVEGRADGRGGPVEEAEPPEAEADRR
ncbi:hypothetical protein C8E97_5614 [Saccharothrix australiensis]|uniref:Uncharacterized protein n=1 Tax=Saccharothrix australiensis TaxID=2072 RepID=A0A495W5C9_9PSEU|nr:hypothetical protein C8E97_5614 [Saccharothrix australiensis]